MSGIKDSIKTFVNNLINDDNIEEDQVEEVLNRYVQDLSKRENIEKSEIESIVKKYINRSEKERKYEFPNFVENVHPVIKGCTLEKEFYNSVNEYIKEKQYKIEILNKSRSGHNGDFWLECKYTNNKILIDVKNYSEKSTVDIRQIKKIKNNMFTNDISIGVLISTGKISGTTKDYSEEFFIDEDDYIRCLITVTQYKKEDIDIIMDKIMGSYKRLEQKINAIVTKNSSLIGGKIEFK